VRFEGLRLCDDVKRAAARHEEVHHGERLDVARLALAGLRTPLAVAWLAFASAGGAIRLPHIAA
jgi:hypothetical protein